MTDTSENKTLSEYLSGIGRQKYKLIFTTIIIFGISAALAFLLPPVYESNATILIEQQAIPKEFVRSTVTSYAEQRIKIISQQAMTRDNLYKIIEKYDLYVDERKSDPIEEIIETMREDTVIDTLNAKVVDPTTGAVKAATIAFTISYKNESPVLAQKVANELVSLFLSENIKNRTKKALETSGFISEEAEKLNRQIQDLEKVMADFKKENADKMPEMFSINMKYLEKSESNINDVERELYLLKEKKIFLESQLAQTEPYLFTGSGVGTLTPEKQVKLLKSQKITLGALYHTGHPDLKRIEKQLNNLQADSMVDDSLLQKELRDTQIEYRKVKQSYTVDHPDVKRLEQEISRLESLIEGNEDNASDSLADYEPDNPAYIQIKTQLETIELEKETLNNKKDDLNEKIAVYEERLSHSPNVEREFRTLARNYENAWKKYRDLKAKQLEAQIAEALELDSKAERFTLIEPPIAPQRPQSPNRVMIITVGMVLAIIIGFVLAILMDATDKRIYSERQLTATVGVPALAIIPNIQTRRDKIVNYLKVGSVTGSVFGVLAVSLFAIHELYKPLDVLWFVLLHKLDLM